MSKKKSKPKHAINPSDIPIGTQVTFACPVCTFSFRHTWLPLDGSQFGDSHCYMHERPVTMVITKVEPTLRAV